MTTVRIALLVIVSLGLAVASCSGPPGGSSTSSPAPVASSLSATGIAGHATAGPVCPVEKNPPDPSCAPRPVAGAVVIIRATAGAAVQQATTGADGTFFVAVPPGGYLVEAQPANGLMGTPGPQIVTVTAGAMSTIELSYDTGIR
jgi:hypothetical protein